MPRRLSEVMCPKIRSSAYLTRPDFSPWVDFMSSLKAPLGMLQEDKGQDLSCERGSGSMSHHHHHHHCHMDCPDFNANENLCDVMKTFTVLQLFHHDKIFVKKCLQLAVSEDVRLLQPVAANIGLKAQNYPQSFQSGMFTATDYKSHLWYSTSPPLNREAREIMVNHILKINQSFWPAINIQTVRTCEVHALPSDSNIKR